MYRDQHNPDPKSRIKQSQGPCPTKSQHSSTQSCQSQGPSNPTEFPALGEVVVGAQTGMSMLVPLKLDNSDVKAVVDSGAQAIVMSDEFYKSLKNPPKDYRESSFENCQ